MQMEGAFDLRPNKVLTYAYGSEVVRTSPILNIGASGVRMRSNEAEVFNHDWREGPGIDLVFDLTEPWPVDDDTYGIIHGHHIIEHIPISKVMTVLSEAHRCLKYGGLLMLECPDLVGTIKVMIDDGNWGMLECLYGRDRYPGDPHRWGYTKETLTTLLYAAGFARCWSGEAKGYAKVQLPCIRVEAIKRDKA